MLHHNNIKPWTGTDNIITSDPPEPVITNEQLLHELSNLLDASTRNIQLAIKRLENYDSQKPPTEQIERLFAAQGALKQIILLLHQWSGHTSKSARLFTKELSISQVIEQTASLLAPKATPLSIRIESRVSSDVAELPAGPLFTVLFNAVLNSIEAISLSKPAEASDGDTNQSTITIDTSLHKDQIQLHVIDDGPGVDKNILDDSGKVIFGQTTKTNGQGQGLALCQEIVSALNGTITLQNRGNTGALLTVMLPLSSVPT